MSIFEPGTLIFALILGAYVLVNFISFSIFAWDKYNAKYGGRRVKEKTLLLISVLFGALGGLAAMMCLNHKTRHKSFTISVPLMLMVHVFVLYLLL